MGNMDVLLEEMEVLLEDMDVLLGIEEVLLGILEVLRGKFKVLSGLSDNLIEKGDRRSHEDELRCVEIDGEFQGFEGE